MIHRKRQEIDTGPQIKQCPIDGSLSYDTRYGRAPWVLVFDRNGPSEQLIDLDFVKHFSYLLHMSIQLVICKPIWKWCPRLIRLLIDFCFPLAFDGSVLEDGLSEVGCTGTGGVDFGTGWDG